jgi:voltage-gated potassium channel
MEKERFKEKVYEVIFGTETRAGKNFDIALLWLIVISTLMVFLESVKSVKESIPLIFLYSEWIFTFVFSLEYIARIYCVRKPLRYIISFYGIIDLMALIPTYLGLFLSGVHFLLIIRILRMLRIFRILKLARYLGEADVLGRALKASFYKIVVFMTGVLSLVIILGALMYVIEGEANGFTSIPKGIYWAIVTVTTVGYGDIAPQTVVGQLIASVAMMVGYAILAVPTGIVTVEISRAQGKTNQQKACYACGNDGFPMNSKFCNACGSKL